MKLTNFNQNILESIELRFQQQGGIMGDDSMKNILFRNRYTPWLVFALLFTASLALGALFGQAQSAIAAPGPAQKAQATGSYAGPEACKACHEETYDTWQSTRHAQAFSSPIFQRDWQAEGSDFTCLECHTTGYDLAQNTYSHEGVTCESCHGPFQPGHPQTLMPQNPDAELCSTCHKTTTDEWRSSPHHAAGIQCQSCHNPHSQTPRAATVTELCTNCHKEMQDTFAHGTHAEAGLECSNCHMYTAPREGDAIMGLVPTGHTFTVGSEACIGCHQDTVHTRDSIVRLSGQVEGVPEVDTETLEQQISQQSMAIQELEQQNSVRLYTGLVQGAIVGLIIGGVVAWVVSRRISIVEVEEEE
jgi:predicted CXXCH cytochrome family protein